MKRFYFTLCIAALGSAAIVSCHKETVDVQDTPKSSTAIMRVNADAVQTKTYIDEVSASEYNIKWSKGDAIACFEVAQVEEEGSTVATVFNKVSSSPLSEACTSGSFTMDFSGNEGSSPFSYIFVYPASKYTKSTNTYRVEIPY